jgi:hypothetical protein
MLKGLENIELHLLRNIPASFHHRLYQAYHNHSINVVRQYRSSMQHYNFCCLNKDTSNQNDHSNSYCPKILMRQLLICNLCFFAHSSVQHILCCVVFLFWISSSIAPYIASFSRLPIFSNQNDHSNSYQYTYLSNTIDNKRSIDQIRVILSYTLKNSEGAIKNG